MCVLASLLQLDELQKADGLLNRLSRVAAAINLRTSDPLTESGHDPVVELRHYYGTVASELTLDWQVWGWWITRVLCSTPATKDMSAV